MSVLSHILLCNPVYCSLPGSSVHEILQARTLEWVAISFSRRFSQRRDWNRGSCGSGFTSEPPGKPIVGNNAWIRILNLSPQPGKWSLTYEQVCLAHYTGKFITMLWNSKPGVFPKTSAHGFFWKTDEAYETFSLKKKKKIRKWYIKYIFKMHFKKPSLKCLKRQTSYHNTQFSLLG